MPDFADVDLGHDWATRYRIPITADPFGLRSSYEVALCVPEADSAANRFGPTTIWPTEDEAAAIGSAIDYRRSYYFEHYQNKMLAEPLDFDSGTRTVLLVKQDDGWRYRKTTWDQVWSTKPTSPDIVGLIELLDDTMPGHGWKDWKQAHPEIFVVPTTS